MANLYLRRADPPHVIWFRMPDGSRDSLPALRLVAFVNLMHDLLTGRTAARYAITAAVIDTGALFSVVGEDLWRQFRPGVVTPLPFDPLTPPHLRSITIAGGTFPYDLGELTLRLEDKNGTALAATVVAKLLRDGGRMPVPLTLGLRGGFFEGRTVHAEPDTAAAFGERWTIEGP